MNAETKRYIDRLFAHHARKMRNIVARGIVSMVDDERKLQETQIRLLDSELVEKAERVQQYGFSSHPQNEAECFVVFAGAGREHPLVFSVDDRRYRVKATKQGEVVIYTDEGDSIHLKRDNTIVVTTKHLVVDAEEDVVFNTKEMTINADTQLLIDTPLIRLRTDNITQEGRGEGMPEVYVKGNIHHEGDKDQIGRHTSTGDQVAGTISQMHHLHQDAGGSGLSGEPQP